VKGFGPARRLFTKKVEIFHTLGAAFLPPAPTEVKFCTAKWTHVPVGHAKFHDLVQRVWFSACE